MIPSVPRANPPSVIATCTSGLCLLLGELQEDEETRGGRLDVWPSHGTGMVKSVGAAGGPGGTIMLLRDWEA